MFEISLSLTRATQFPGNAGGIGVSTALKIMTRGKGDEDGE